MSQIAPIGYAGQKYAVYAVVNAHDGHIVRRLWGWTNEQDGGSLAKAVMQHPDTISCVVVEVKPEDKA